MIPRATKLQGNRNERLHRVLLARDSGVSRTVMPEPVVTGEEVSVEETEWTRPDNTIYVGDPKRGLHCLIEPTKDPLRPSVIIRGNVTRRSCRIRQNRQFYGLHPNWETHIITRVESTAESVYAQE